MLDTERPAIKLWVEVAGEFGYPLDEAVPISTVGLDEGATRDRVLEACGRDFPYDQIRSVVEVRYREFMEERGPALRPGLPVLLDTLDSLNIPMAVATSSPRRLATERLARAGILERFRALACGDEVTRGKPNPDIFYLAARRVGAQAPDCVGFEDSPAGLRALAAGGIRSVFVMDSVEPPPELLATVWRRCEDLAEASRLFG